MIRLNTPIRIALFSSLIIVGLSILSYYILDYIDSKITTLIFIFISTLFIIYFIIKSFLHEKIKVIYKNIYKFKGTSRLKDLDIDNVEKEAEEWANKKEKELQQLKTDENYRREFIGNVSHELKTPIFNIQGYVQTLIDGGIEDSDVNMKYLNRANKSVERMINIVEDLEVISKLETDTEQLLIEKFNISIVVKEVLEHLEMQANNANISLEFTNESSADFNELVNLSAFCFRNKSGDLYRFNSPTILPKKRLLRSTREIFAGLAISILETWLSKMFLIFN